MRNAKSQGLRSYLRNVKCPVSRNAKCEKPGAATVLEYSLHIYVVLRIRSIARARVAEKWAHRQVTAAYAAAAAAADCSRFYRRSQAPCAAHCLGRERASPSTNLCRLQRWLGHSSSHAGRGSAGCALPACPDAPQDLGYNDLGIRNGGKTITPHIDELIRTGVTLSSYCAPRVAC